MRPDRALACCRELVEGWSVCTPSTSTASVACKEQVVVEAAAGSMIPDSKRPLRTLIGVPVLDRGRGTGTRPGLQQLRK